jgi:hypothetical protein
VNFPCREKENKKNRPRKEEVNVFPLVTNIYIFQCIVWKFENPVA